MKSWLLILFLLVYVLDSFAQKQDKHNHTVGYHHIFYSGVQINTNGFGGGLRRGFHETARKKKLYEMGFTTLKHSREVKMLSSDGGDGFVFAKKNSVNMNVLEAAWKTNLEVRPEKDWENLKGRAVSENE